MAKAAPYFAAIAQGPENGAAYWLKTADGVRVRAGAWQREDAKGTLLLLPGRTEYIEKYGRTAAEIGQRGFAMMAIDWRGQGLADRLLPDRRVGHVARFTDFQQDLSALVALAEELGMPRPFYVLGHSMGGAIGIRAVMDGMDVNACIFTGPMWGILMASLLRPVAWGLYFASGWTGQGHRLPPTTKYETYVLAQPFEDNALTTDPEMYAMMRGQLEAHPELSLGGPSLTWLGEAMGECRTLARRPAPDLPCITYAGSGESIVDVEAMAQRMDGWPGGKLEIVQGARHEVLMEKPALRNPVLDEIAALFEASATRQTRARSA